MSKELLASVNALYFATLPDGREICLDTPRGRLEYRQRTLAMRTRQGSLCRWCGHFMREEETTFDHDALRNGRQDDRIEIAGQRINAAVHKLCNSERGSQRKLTRTLSQAPT